MLVMTENTAGIEPDISALFHISSEQIFLL